MTVKLAIIYYSTYGLNHKMAEIAADAAREAGAEVRLLRVPEIAPAEVVEGQPGWKAHAEATNHIPTATPQDMEWADAYLFSAPTRFGLMASQMRAFIDTLGGTWAAGKLTDKPVSAMSSANNTHGGQEQTILSFHATICHWGGIAVPPGFTHPSIAKTGGNPYGYSHTNGEKFTEDMKDAIRHQTRRLIGFAEKLS